MEKTYNYEIVTKNYFKTKYIQNLNDKYKGRWATFQSAMKLTLFLGQLFALNPVIISLHCLSTTLSKLPKQSKDLAYTPNPRWPDGMGRPEMRWQMNPLVALYDTHGKRGGGPFLFYSAGTTYFALISKTSIVFYGTNCLTTICFLRMATQWPALCRHISKTEGADPNPDYSLISRCNLTCIVILSLALVEHVLSDLAGVAVVIDCFPKDAIFGRFVQISFPWIFNYVTYNHFIGGLAMFINLQCTFNWNFADVFVICISYYLTSRLEQINKRISTISVKYVPPSLWRVMREDYCRVVQLIRRIDEVINGVIFISFANNLYFICVQLLHTLEDGLKGTPACNSRQGGPLKGYEHAIYFVYSFIFLMSRSLAVSLIAARVHSATLDSASSLYEVPSPVYCIEVQRLIDQINGDTVSLSGLNFFNVKRGLVLSIAGTIITYELVLIQFSGVTPSAPTNATLILNSTETV